MGLRVNYNPMAAGALRNLGNTDRLQARSLERLSTGLRINTAADDPSGLVISERLRSQIASMRQAIDNSQFAANLIGTAEAALSEVNSLLIDIRTSVIFALNHGATTREEILAEQDAVDMAIGAIDRIAVTTRFGGKNLLDGSSAFQVSASPSIDEINVRRITFGNAELSSAYNIQVNSLASRAVLSFNTQTSGNQICCGSSGNFAILRVNGSLGTQDIYLASGSTFTDLATAVNRVSSQTGVYMSNTGTGTASGNIALMSTQFGSQETITITNVTASGSGISFGTNFGGNLAQLQNGQGQAATDTGTDLSVTIDGARTQVDGYQIRVLSDFLDADILLSERVAAGTSYAFSVKNNINSGLTFQLNQEATASDRISIGLKSIATTQLGTLRTPQNQATAMVDQVVERGGFLTSLKSGDTNDLLNNATNALKIVDQAIKEVSDMRAFMGAIKADNIDTNISSLNIAVENLSASESTVRDLDFAEETTQFTKWQIMFQAGTAVLASANMIPQTVLSLLGG